MDREETLNLELIPFFKCCADYGKAIEDYCLEEAYPGVSNTSYFITVKAAWMDDLGLYEILEYLFERLFESTSVETRKNVFGIRVRNSSIDLHKLKEQNIRNSYMY